MWARIGAVDLELFSTENVGNGLGECNLEIMSDFFGKDCGELSLAELHQILVNYDSF